MCPTDAGCRRRSGRARAECRAEPRVLSAPAAIHQRPPIVFFLLFTMRPAGLHPSRAVAKHMALRTLCAGSRISWSLPSGRAKRGPGGSRKRARCTRPGHEGGYASTHPRPVFFLLFTGAASSSLRACPLPVPPTEVGCFRLRRSMRGCERGRGRWSRWTLRRRALARCTRPGHEDGRSRRARPHIARDLAAAVASRLG